MKLLFPILLLSAAIGQSGQVPRSDMPPETTARPPVASGQTEDPSAQKARALVQQAIQALGGQAYLNITDMEQQGRTYGFYHGENASPGAPFWRFWRWPDRDRTELTKRRDWIIIYNGDKGNEITFRGTTSVEPVLLKDYLRRREYSLEWVLRRWINEPGVAYFYDGAGIADQRPAEKVSIMNGRSQSVTLYLDVNSHLPLKKTFQWRDEDRYLNEESESWDNYRRIQGIMTPFSITRAKNGETTNQRFINSVTYNQGLQDSMFAATVTLPPKKK